MQGKFTQKQNDPNSIGSKRKPQQNPLKHAAHAKGPKRVGISKPRDLLPNATSFCRGNREHALFFAPFDY